MNAPAPGRWKILCAQNVAHYESICLAPGFVAWHTGVGGGGGGAGGRGGEQTRWKY